ncbi:MAG: hypothetical protein LWX56_02080, partial [Ignavibacteria bacterium]|nr:hypothetical protein [Ignavibacteria bacterium]
MKAQSDSVESVVLFPQDLNFLPLKGYASEPRLGIIYYTATTNLKVDVGTTLELLQFRLPDTAADIKVGIEFMAYAYSTSYSGYRLQISTLDGMFGGHAAYLHEAKDMTTSIRFRYIHNSAHLVDGNYIPATNSWINDKLPIPFTRDFAELTYAPIFHQSFAHIRPYAGCTQAFRVRPEVIKRASYFTGLELYSRSPLTSILKKPVILFASYHLQINGVPEYTASHDFQAGFKIGEWNKK